MSQLQQHSPSLSEDSQEDIVTPFQTASTSTRQQLQQQDVSSSHNINDTTKPDQHTHTDKKQQQKTRHKKSKKLPSWKKRTLEQRLVHASCITPWLYLAGRKVAADRQVLDAVGVTHILNMTCEVPNSFPNDFVYSNVRTVDEVYADILSVLPSTCVLLDRVRRDHIAAAATEAKPPIILVHCAAGVSRSASVVIAYFISHGQSLNDARAFVKVKRKQISPNIGFLKQLKRFQDQVMDARLTLTHTQSSESSANSNRPNTTVCETEQTAQSLQAAVSAINDLDAKMARPSDPDGDDSFSVRELTDAIQASLMDVAATDTDHSMSHSAVWGAYLATSGVDMETAVDALDTSLRAARDHWMTTTEPNVDVGTYMDAQTVTFLYDGLSLALDRGKDDVNAFSQCCTALVRDRHTIQLKHVDKTLARVAEFFDEIRLDIPFLPTLMRGIVDSMHGSMLISDEVAALLRQRIGQDYSGHGIAAVVSDFKDVAMQLTAAPAIESDADHEPLKPPIIFLSSIDDTLHKAWTKHCGSIENVRVLQGDIFQCDCDAVVSPANSFGFMDGGIDMLYSKTFGWHVQARVQDAIRSRHFGELIVGAADIVETDHTSIPFLIAAPTMRVPAVLPYDTHAPYLAARAALLLIKHGKFTNGQHAGKPIGSVVRSVAFPGLGTGIGRVSADVCARQVAMAIREFGSAEAYQRKNVRFPASWMEALADNLLLHLDNGAPIEHVRAFRRKEARN
jgi:O-acetyl-ADP-ribose deacetylase (regulator of RNase III)/protein-tyrosine phosphatase